MNAEQVTGVVRHVLTFVGGYLVTKGVVDEATMVAAVGSLATLAGIVWSYAVKMAK